MAVALIIGGAFITGCSVYSLKARVQGVADLAALAAGAEAAVSGVMVGDSGGACEIVAQVALRNDVEVEQCATRNGDVYVHLARTYDLAGFDVGVHAYARAGAAHPLIP